MRDVDVISNDLDVYKKRVKELEEELRLAKLGDDIPDCYEFEDNDQVVYLDQFHIVSTDVFSKITPTGKGLYLAMHRAVFPVEFKELMKDVAVMHSVYLTLAYCKTRLEPEYKNRRGGWIVEFDTMHDHFAVTRNVILPNIGPRYYVVFEYKENAIKAANFINKHLGLTYTDAFLEGNR